MNSSKNKIFAILISASTVSLAICFAIMAWTEPSTSPPAGNIAAPVNTSAYPQTKAGDLTIGGGLTITSDGTSFALKANNETDNGFFVVGQDGHTGINTEPASGMSLDVNGQAQANELCLSDGCCSSWQACNELAGAGGIDRGVVDVKTERPWTAVAMSSNGKYQTAIVSRGNLFVSSNYGLAWFGKEVYSSGQIEHIAMSGDGKYQVFTAAASGANDVRDVFYVSNNYGATGSWTSKPLTGVTDIAVSASENGKYQIMIQDNVAKFSINTGDTWTNVPGGGLVGKGSSVAISGDGKYMAVAVPICTDYPDGGYSLTNANYGSGNWTRKNLPDGAIISVALSSNGQFQIAGVQGGSTKTGPYVWISTDFGASWNKQTVETINTDRNETYSTSVAISGDGKVRVAANLKYDELGYGRKLSISRDGGSWLPAGPDAPTGIVFPEIAVSQNGQYITTIGGEYRYRGSYICGGYSFFDLDTSDYIYRSADFGATWTEL
jgi:hypothetical protein